MEAPQARGGTHLCLPPPVPRGAYGHPEFQTRPRRGMEAHRAHLPASALGSSCTVQSDRSADRTAGRNQRHATCVLIILAGSRVSHQQKYLRRESRATPPAADRPSRSLSERERERPQRGRRRTHARKHSPSACKQPPRPSIFVSGEVRFPSACKQPPRPSIFVSGEASSKGRESLKRNDSFGSPSPPPRRLPLPWPVSDDG